MTEGVKALQSITLEPFLTQQRMDRLGTATWPVGWDHDLAGVL